MEKYDFLPLDNLVLTVINEQMCIELYTPKKLIEVQENSTKQENEDFIQNLNEQTSERKFFIKSAVIKKSTGSLLFDFISANFNDINGYLLFIKTWGFISLLNTTEECKSSFIFSEKEIHEIFKRDKDPILDAQENFKKVVEFCVNANNEIYLKELTPVQRYFFGFKKNLIPNLNEYITTYTKNIIPLTLPKEPFYKNEYSEDDSNGFSKFISSMDIYWIDQYYCRSIIMLVYLEFFNLLRNFSINKCSNCGIYFIPQSKNNEIYCENCRSIGYINKLKNDDLLSIYNTAYKTKHAQKQRKIKGKDNLYISNYEIALKKWREEARVLLNEAKSKYDKSEDQTERENISLAFKLSLDNIPLEV